MDTPRMSGVAEQLRRDDRARQERMTTAECLAEALALGQAAITMYASAHGLAREEACRCLERAAQAGRRPSRVMREISG